MLLIAILSFAVSAFDVRTIYNPFTSKLDYIRGSNWSNENISANNVSANVLCIYGDSCITAFPSPGGGSGADKWTDNGSFLQPNTSYADNVFVNGWLNATQFIFKNGEALSWDTDHYAAQIPTGLGNTIQIGQELTMIPLNDAGRILTEGEIVYISGNKADRLLVKLANSSDGEKIHYLGMVTIPTCQTNANCPITLFGEVHDLDTSIYEENTSIYLNSTGGFTNVTRNPPEFNIHVGQVVRSHATEGKVFFLPEIDIGDGVVMGELYLRDNLTVKGNAIFDGFINSSNGVLNFDSIFNYSDGSQIRFGSAQGVTGTDTAINLYNNQNLAGGTPVFMVESSGSMHILIVKGLNNSVRLMGNSWAIIEEKWVSLIDNNATNVSNIYTLYDHYNVTPFFDADTGGYGATLFVQGGLDVWRQFRVLEGITMVGGFSGQLEGNDFNIINGSLHIATPTTFLSGFEFGDYRKVLDEKFEASLGSFINDPDNTQDWFLSADSECEEGQCAKALGVIGEVTNMSANFTTSDVNESMFSFVYSLNNLLGSDSFTVTINNNTGSGDVVLFTDSGTDTKVHKNFTLGIRFWNVSANTVTFTCDTSITTRACYVDNVLVNGTHTANNTATVEGFDSEICFSDATRDSRGQCNRGLFYNASDDTVYTVGNWNVSGVGGTGIGGSGTANNLAKFTASETLGNSNLVDTGSVILATILFNVTNEIRGNTIVSNGRISGDSINATTFWARDAFNSSGNITAVDKVKGATIEGVMGWSNLSAYPAACSSGYWLTEVGDTNVCTLVPENDTTRLEALITGVIQLNDSRTYDNTTQNTVITTLNTSHETLNASHSSLYQRQLKDNNTLYTQLNVVNVSHSSLYQRQLKDNNTVSTRITTLNNSHTTLAQEVDTLNDSHETLNSSFTDLYQKQLKDNLSNNVYISEVNKTDNIVNLGFVTGPHTVDTNIGNCSVSRSCNNPLYTDQEEQLSWLNITSGLNITINTDDDFMVSQTTNGASALTIRTQDSLVKFNEVGAIGLLSVSNNFYFTVDTLDAYFGLTYNTKKISLVGSGGIRSFNTHQFDQDIHLGGNLTVGGNVTINDTTWFKKGINVSGLSNFTSDVHFFDETFHKNDTYSYYGNGTNGGRIYWNKTIGRLVAG